jgi:hypothetical protein
MIFNKNKKMKIRNRGRFTRRAVFFSENFGVPLLTNIENPRRML